MGKDFLVLFRRLVLIIIRFENPIMKTTSRMWGRLFSFSNFFKSTHPERTEKWSFTIPRMAISSKVPNIGLLLFRCTKLQFFITMKNQAKFANKKVPEIIKSLKNPNSKVQQGFQLENYGFQLE